jgi:hypothetical protein
MVADLQLSSGIQAVTQEMRLRMGAFRGDWFLDLDYGIPYFQELLGQKFDVSRARNAFRSALAASDNIVQVNKLNVEFDGVTRSLSVAWEVLTDIGTAFETTEIEV